jgi:hypothetical protein
MLGRVDGWNSSMSMTLISSTSKERRTRWLMHSIGECIMCETSISMYQTNIKGRISETAKVDL